MTRIASYGLYKCLTCSQVHIKPNYGSISIYVPVDAFVKDSDIVTCKSCGIKRAISSYIYLGMRSKENSYKPNIFERILIRLKILNASEERDVRKVYPSLLD